MKVRCSSGYTGLFELGDADIRALNRAPEDVRGHYAQHSEVTNNLDLVPEPPFYVCKGRSWAATCSCASVTCSASRTATLTSDLDQYWRIAARDTVYSHSAARSERQQLHQCSANSAAQASNTDHASRTFITLMRISSALPATLQPRQSQSSMTSSYASTAAASATTPASPVSAALIAPPVLSPGGAAT